MELLDQKSPRIKGRTGLITDGPHEGKIAYEITMWDMLGLETFASFTFGPFESEDDAKTYGRAKTTELVKMFQVFVGQEPSGERLNFKSGKYEK